MSLPVVNDCAKVVVRGHIGSHLMQNVFHVLADSPVTQSAAQLFGDDIADALANVTPQMNATCGFDTVEVYDLATVGGPQFTILPATFPLVGALTGGSLPPSSCGLVSWRGASGGRSGRGRTYLGGFDEDASDGDSLDTAALAALQDFADAIVGSSVEYQVLSYYSGTDKTQVNKKNVPIPRVIPLVTPITFGVARPTWFSQRRRQD